MGDEGSTLSIDKAVEQSLFCAEGQLLSNLTLLCSPFGTPEREQDKKIKQTTSSGTISIAHQPVALKAKERRDLVRQCKKLRGQLGEDPANGTGTGDHDKEALKTKYKSWKRAIRFSAAAQIQAVWKGCAVFLPCSLVVHVSPFSFFRFRRAFCNLLAGT